MLVSGRSLVPGDVTAEAVILKEPLSFWGGFDLGTREVVDRRHPQCSVNLSGWVLVMPSGQGSSSSSSVLAEAIRVGTSPVGIVLFEPDRIVVLGAMVGAESYSKRLPVVLLNEDDYRSIRPGCTLGLNADEFAALVQVAPARHSR